MARNQKRRMMACPKCGFRMFATLRYKSSRQPCSLRMDHHTNSTRDSCTLGDVPLPLSQWPQWALDLRAAQQD